MSRLAPANGRDVKLRIYKDFDALRHYQAGNIQGLRNNIASVAAASEGQPEVEEIATEDGI